MNTTKRKLYSRRHSVARGNFWLHERDVTVDTAQHWLRIFRYDEPKVLFLVADKKPR